MKFKLGLAFLVLSLFMIPVFATDLSISQSDCSGGRIALSSNDNVTLTSNIDCGFSITSVRNIQINLNGFVLNMTTTGGQGIRMVNTEFVEIYNGTFDGNELLHCTSGGQETWGNVIIHDMSIHAITLD